MGLAERVGNGVKRGGLGGNWDPGSLALTGDALLSVGALALWRDCLAAALSLFDSVVKPLGEDSLVGGSAVTLSVERSL